MERAAAAFDVVLLVDGVFHHDLAPSPKECYAALARARMFGASSMGALRAVECAPYGFTPLGAIARWYLDGTIDGDDEVAVLTDPQTHAALTVPLVNVRYAARIARRRGIFDRAAAAELVAAARAIHYADRTWPVIASRLPPGVRAALARIPYDDADLKRLDARTALRNVLRRRERTGAGRALRLPPTLPKATGAEDRSVPLRETMALLPAIRARYGITRVAETTLLDRIGVPTFAAMVPRSPDMLGVYNGKGTTHEAALVSAVMEAAERQIGAAVPLPVFRESLRAVGERIDLDGCGVRPDVRDLVVECVTGTELFSGRSVPVPLALVQCPWPGTPICDATSTNGLASGNDPTEALYHALCESIERHVWSLHHLRGAILPRLHGGADATDRAVAPQIVLPTGNAAVDRLAAEIEAAGLRLRVFCLRDGELPATMLASIAEPHSHPPMAHMGLGCGLSPAHALLRALTEAVQSRVTDIQAAREDILRPGDDARGMSEHARRPAAPPKDRWYGDLPLGQIALADLPDRATRDLAEDLRRVLSAMRATGIAQAIAVDLSPDGLPVSVVRAIVPGLETFVFTGRIGARGRDILNPFAVRSAP